MAAISSLWLGGLFGCGGSGSTSIGVASSSLSKATAYQINPSHSGSISFGVPLHFASKPAWSVRLGKSGANLNVPTASYPLIVGGKVVLLIFDATGANLYALDERSGKTVWGPIALGGLDGYPFGGLASDDGKVFALNSSGILQSFDINTGASGWSVRLSGQTPFACTPTVVNGIIYVSEDSSFGVNETNGQILWTNSINGREQVSPTVSLGPGGASSTVFVTSPCQNTALDPGTGAVLWQTNVTCSGVESASAAVANGKLYVGGLMTDTIYNAIDGSTVASFGAADLPAIDADRRYFVNPGALQAVGLASQDPIWSFAGDGGLASSPIVIDQTVIAASGSGTVYALASATGKQIWSGSAGVPFTLGSPLPLAHVVTGLAAGEGYLVVPYNGSITAWHIAGN